MMINENLLLLVILCVSITTPLAAQTTFYLDSEYTGAISNGEKDTPYQKFEEAFSSACKSEVQSPGTVKTLFLIPRPTGYSILQPMSYSNCGTLELRSLPTPELSLIEIQFFRSLSINSSTITFDSIHFKFAMNETKLNGIPLLAMFNSSTRISNCHFVSSTNPVRTHIYFLNFTSGNITIEDSTFDYGKNSASNVFKMSRVTLQRSKIFTDLFAMASLFNLNGQAEGESSIGAIEPLFNVSEITIFMSTKEYKQLSINTGLFLVKDINSYFDQIRIVGYDQPSYVLKQLIFFITFTQSTFTFHLRNFSMTQVAIFTRILSLQMIGTSSDIILDRITLEEIEAENAYVNEDNKPYFHFQLERGVNSIQITNVVINSLRTEKSALGLQKKYKHSL